MLQTDWNSSHERLDTEVAATSYVRAGENSLSTSGASRQSPRVAVIGDIMVDVDVDCRCERICQEGPWPVFLIERTRSRLGGAGNVAAMLRALECEVILLGLVGRDDCNQVPKTNVEIGWRLVDGATTKKTRFWYKGRLTGPRVDYDQTGCPSRDDIDHFIQSIEQFGPQVVVVADHGKGVVTVDLMQQLGALNIPVLVDPILKTPLPFRPAAIAGGNHELGPGARQAKVVIEKRGSEGLAWTAAPHEFAPVVLASTCRKLADPLGAGDQFIASLAYQRCLGSDWPEAITWANQAAGLQCEQPGCIPLGKHEIDEVIQSSHHRSA